MFTRRTQDIQVVVNEECALGIAWLDRLEGRPEVRRLLGDPEIMCADDALQMTGKRRAFELERERLLMGVGDQDAPLAERGQSLQELHHMRMDRDQMLDLTLEQYQIQPQLTAPVVDAIPFERSRDVAIAGQQLGTGRLERQAARLAIAARDVFEPEMVVEVQIEQGAVHVEEDGVDPGPVDGFIDRGHGVRVRSGVRRLMLVMATWLAVGTPVWALDIRTDLEAAVAAGKRGLMVYFGQEDCVHCEHFKQVNLADPDILAYLRRHFDLVSVDIQGRTEVRTLDGERLDVHAWARREQTDFTPSLLFYDAEGRLALRLRGYYPTYQFRAALEYVADGHYRRESFDAYLARGDERLVFDSEDLNDQPFFSPPPHVLDRWIPAERPLAVFFERGDCHPCDVLHGRVLRAPEIRRRFEALDAVQLDRRSDTPVITPDGERTTAHAWADALGLFHAPAILFFDERGRELLRLDSVVGFQRLAQVLDDIARRRSAIRDGER